MNIKFGTDGVRGPANVWPITAEAGVRIGRAAALLAQSHGGNRVVVAHDTRPSAGELEAAVVAGVVAQGGQCLRAGMVPTSAMGVAVAAGLAQAGVMITASHNGAADNGFKLVGEGGRKLDDQGITRVEAWLEAPPDSEGAGSQEDAHQVVLSLWQTTARDCLGDTQALAQRRIVVDLAHGAGTALQDWIRAIPGVEWSFIGSGDGVINDGVGSEHPQRLAEQVRALGCDAGIAVDGDADRCVLVDEQGIRVAGDALTWLLCRQMNARSLAVTVMSNGALEALLPGVQVTRTPVGDRHLREAMDTHGIALGAEESGHVLFADFAAGDGVLTGLRALLAAWSRADTVSEAVAPFQALPRQLDKIRVAGRPPLNEVPAIQAVVAKCTSDLGAHGRVFLRYSGTEPVLRLLVEGAGADAVQRAMTEVRDVCEQALQ